MVMKLKGLFNGIVTFLKGVSIKTWVTVAATAAVATTGVVVGVNLPQHEHAYGEWAITQEATCTQTGVQVRTCECGEQEQESIPALGHTEAIDASVEPTCNSTGFTEGKHCSVCNLTIVPQEIIDKIAHTPATDAAVEATCSATGLTEGSHCSVCNAVITAQQVVAKKVHTVVVDAAVDATCDSTGLTEGNHCSVCNATLVAQRVTSKLTHVLSVKITDIPETCSDDGTYYIECTLCHIILERGILESGHDYEATVVPPTASAQGYTQHVCSRCNDTYTDTIVPALGFTGLAYVINEDGRTCTITGLGSVTETEIAIPLEIDGYKVTAIGDKAFENCTHLTKILLQDSITTIGTRAFYGCTGLTEFTIPKNVRNFGTQIFYKSSNINTISYNSDYGPENNDPIFSLSHIKTVIFGGTKIPSNILRDCGNVKEIIILDSVKKIEYYAFSGCTSLESISIGSGLEQIDDGVFSNCTKLSKVNIESIEQWCGISFYKYIHTTSSPIYYSKSLYLNNELVTDITIPGTVESVKNFEYCESLVSITIENGVESIGGDCFYNCTNLKTMCLPSTIKYIACDAFTGCNNIESTYYVGTLSGFLSISLNNNGWGQSECFAGGNLYINNQLMEDVYIPDDITVVKKNAFGNFTSIETVYIPDSVVKIEAYAFAGCSNLKMIVLPDSISIFEAGIFQNCNNLCQIYYQGSVEDWEMIYNSSQVPTSIVKFGYDAVEHTYTLMVNGGDNVESITSVVAIELPTPTKEGYYFGGWYDNAELNGTPLASPYYSTSNHTLYAKWFTEEEWLWFDGTTFEKAMFILSGETKDVVIDTAGERVYFKFVATETRSYTISSQGGLDTYGHLYNSSTSQIASNNGGNDFSITYTLTAGETYYIAARMYSSSATGTFTITIS